MTKEPLGRLEKIDLRKYWSREATEFTPWLAQPENIRLLSEALGLDLEVEQTEADVGPFRADILCRDLRSNTFVLVENQLERTDHAHLGQIITYASGLDAARVVWVAPAFTEEHRSALDWLNRVTGEQLHFFGVEVELWRIATSPPAPRFNVVAKPNDWTKRVREKASGGAPTAQGLAYRAFWDRLSAYLAKKGAAFKIKPTGINWVRVDFGRPEPQPTVSYSFNEQRAKFYLFFRREDSASWFKRVYAERAGLEKALGEAAMHWDLRREYARIVADFEGDPAAVQGRVFDWVLRKVGTSQKFVNGLGQ